MLNFWYKIPQHERRITIPTLVTLLRLFLIPFIVLTMLLHRWDYAFNIFIIAASTDGIDGYLARSRNEKTILGAALDALADKLLIIACFTSLAFVHSPLFSIPLWFVVSVLFKEALLVCGVIYIANTTGHIQIKPTLLGKGTMVAQLFFIIWLFACYFFLWMPVKTYYGMLGLLLGLVVASLIHYAYIGLRFLIVTSPHERS